MMTQEQFTNDAVELLKKLIATPSAVSYTHLTLPTIA